MRGFNPEAALLRQEGMGLAERDLRLILESSKEEKVDEQTFSDIYSSDEIARDKAEVKRLQEQWKLANDRLTPHERNQQELAKLRSDALEATIVHMGELSNWFGENAYVFRTTTCDDVLNGIDAVVEIEPDEQSVEKKPQRFALAIDASTAADTNVITEKIYRNTEKIMGTYKKPSRVKYFESQITSADEDEPFKGQLDNIIPVVVGVEMKNAAPLMSLYMEILKLKRISKRSPEQKQELKLKLAQAAIHPSQRLFLDEISAQLNMYEALIGDKKPELLNEIQRLQDFIIDLKITKNHIFPDKILEADAVATTISSTCSSFVKKSQQ